MAITLNSYIIVN